MQARIEFRKSMATVFAENGLPNKVNSDRQQQNSKEEQAKEKNSLLLQDPFHML